MPSSNPKLQRQFYLSADASAQIDELAARLGTTRSQAVVAAVEAALKGVPSDHTRGNAERIRAR